MFVLEPEATIWGIDCEERRAKAIVEEMKKEKKRRELEEKCKINLLVELREDGI